MSAPTQVTVRAHDRDGHVEHFVAIDYLPRIGEQIAVSEEIYDVTMVRHFVDQNTVLVIATIR